MRTKPRSANCLLIWTTLAFLGIVCLTGTGCSTKTPKYPEDHARFQRVVQAINTLESAYVNQDAQAFHELLLPLEQLEILESETQQDFATFSNIHLDLTLDRILIDGNRISAFISWQGTWNRSSQDSNESASGHGVLLWSGNQVILLRGIQGDIPFGINSRLQRSS